MLSGIWRRGTLEEKSSSPCDAPAPPVNCALLAAATPRLSYVWVVLLGNLPTVAGLASRRGSRYGT
jgi:hypothetical protein